MAEYIEREAAIAALEKLPCQGDIDSLSVYEVMEYLPAADVVEVRHGEWEEIIDTKSTIHRYQHTCGACGKSYFDHNKFNYPYCPNCGADMRGDKNG